MLLRESDQDAELAEIVHFREYQSVSEIYVPIKSAAV